MTVKRFQECVGMLNTCVRFQSNYTLEEFQSMREKGYTTVIFGYLDENWDGEFCRLDNYAHTSIFTDMVPQDFVEKNRKELSRRLACAKEAGLKVWMSVWGPITGQQLWGPKLTSTQQLPIRPELKEKYGQYFGTGGDTWGGAGYYPMCLSYPEVRERYRQLMRDAVESFPGIDGFLFWGADSYSIVCDETCPRCNANPCWKNFLNWVVELKKEAETVRDDLEFIMLNWPWWDDMFDMAEVAPVDISFMANSSWGVSYKGKGNRYPALIEPWECQEFQEDTIRVPVNHEHKTVYELTQQWINSPVSDKFKRLAKICYDQGRKFYGQCDFTTSEAVMPYYTPYPVTTLSRLRSFAEADAYGISEFWGIPGETISGEHVDANMVLLTNYLNHPEMDDQALLDKTAEIIYGKGNESEAKHAWELIDEALAKWPIIGYSQRMHWNFRRLWPERNDMFYVFDLTLPYIKKDAPRTSGWPQLLYNPEIWKGMKEYLYQVIDCYDRALACYDRICLRAQGEELKNAVFHRDCVTLTRCYFQIALESCDYHIAGLNGEKLSKDYIRQAAVTRRLCRKLYTSLNVAEYENDMSEVLANMSSYEG